MADVAVMSPPEPLLDHRFWGGRKVLLTGHTGFKGAWMTMLLQRLGARVVGLSLEAETPSLFEQAQLAGRIEAHHVADLRDAARIKAIVQTAQPEIVIHLAAQSLVRLAYKEPALTFDTNVMGTVNLFEALRGQSSVQVILTTTTDKVYYNEDLGRNFVEQDRLGGKDPYSASKAATEAVVAAYRASFQAPSGVISLVARAGNIVGGGDWATDRLVPDAVRAAHEHVPLAVRSPASTRPWQHVLDGLIGYLMLIEYATRHRPAFDDPTDAAFNFGPLADQPSATVAQVCDWISEIWPERFSWIAGPAPDSGMSMMKESKLLGLNSDKAARMLGWRPQMSSHGAIVESINWYKGLFAGRDPFELCKQQIEVRLVAAHASV